MSVIRYLLIVIAAYSTGLLSAELIPDADAQTAKRPKVPATDAETLARIRKSMTGSKWNLGGKDFQQFLSDMKTTNQLNRTGNRVVTDAQTLLTGGRGRTGAIYVWKLEKSLRRATIHKYVRDSKWSKTVTRIP